MSALAKRLADERARLGEQAKPVHAPAQTQPTAVAEPPQDESEPGAANDDGPPTAAQIAGLRQSKAADDKQLGADALSGLTDSLVVFLDQNNAARLEVPRVTGRVDAVPANSGIAFDYIVASAHARTGKALAKSTIENILALKRAEARNRGDIRLVHNRIAPSPAAPDGVLIDLANDAGQVVQVDAQGVTVLPTSPVPFARGTGTGELPQPTTMTCADAFDCLQTAFVDWGVTDPSDRAVLMVVLCEWLRPGTPKPLLEIVGPAGAAKSTLAEHLIALVDPTPADRPPSFKCDEANVMAATRQRYALLIDNASRFTPDEQDLLCRIATGGSISHRALTPRAKRSWLKCLRRFWLLR